ncbi:MAG TPA: hypothetical protein VFS05_08025 [Gemmatimonadaceae bacterium]|nr:hypothetical protein [Gemmatimonadaceae bacterium]
MTDERPSPASTPRAAARRGRLSVVLLLALLGAASPVAAQGADAAQEQPPVDTTVVRRVSGRIVKPGERGEVGVPGVWVVLHRVGSDRAAPLDSMRSGAGGRYDFRYRASGRADAIYFISAEYGGVAYFSSPLRAATVTGDDATITVFDTTTGPIALSVRGRHFVLGAPAPDGARTAIEVFELSNDSSRTLISPDDSRPTWTTALPEGARDVRAEQGEIAPDALQVADGRVRVIAPFAPGLKQVGLRYTLPASSFPLSIPLADAVQVLEVLVEDSTTTVEGARLAPTSPVSVEGRTFRRWTATDVPRNAVFRIVTRGQPAAGRRPLYIAGALLALGAAMLIGIARAFRRREAAAIPVLDRAAVAPDAERLARAIAELDDRFERLTSPTERERAEYEAHRGELKRRLADALAGGPGRE